MFQRRPTIMNASPSVGGLGIHVDRVNSRVKGILPRVVRGGDYAPLIDMLHDGRNAVLLSGSTRLTLRAFVDLKSASYPALLSVLEEQAPHNYLSNIEAITPISLKSGETLYLVYLAWNSVERDISLNNTYPYLKTPFVPRTTFPTMDLRRASSKDLDQLLHLYQEAFSNYFVDLDKDVILQLCEEGNLSVAVRDGRVLAALAAEAVSLVLETSNGKEEVVLVELSEAATLKQVRGQGIMQMLISGVVAELRNHIPHALVYAETRAFHPASPIAFMKSGGQPRGLLRQACVIDGDRVEQFSGLKYEDLALIVF